MTEEEAKTKACCGPFAGRVPYASAAEAQEISLQGLDPEYTAEVSARWPCIASACMAWRQTPEVVHALDAHQEAQSWQDAGWRIEQRLGGRVAVSGGGGFCGLAGRPQ